jgi:threonine synthase
VEFSLYSHLECSSCGSTYAKEEVHNYCHSCNQPLLARYALNERVTKRVIRRDKQSMWRYEALLPILNDEHIVTLGEGWTPMLPLRNISRKLGLHTVLLKEEAANPTGSFKARGLGMAISKARELGLKEFCIPTAGNAGSALAAYAVAAGGKAHVYMPEATPHVFKLDCEVMGARVEKVAGSIRDAGLKMAADNTDGKWWDVTTLKEPFRLEGKKTMGYEIAEQLDWELPDVIIYPTGGGTGLIGIWKAFQEMKVMGWIQDIPTKMVAVQTVGCNPVVQSFNQGMDYCEVYQNPMETIVNGLRVPKAFGDRLIMKTIYESGGTAIDISEQEILDSVYDFGKSEGIFLSPEGAAVFSAFQKLVSSGFISPKDRTILINTGSPYKYAENFN